MGQQGRRLGRLEAAFSAQADALRAAATLLPLVHLEEAAGGGSGGGALAEEPPSPGLLPEAALGRPKRRRTEAPDPVAPLRQQVAVVKQERDAAQDATQCIACAEREREVIFLPCGHALVCRACDGNLQDQDRCPSCRSPIAYRRRFYL